MNSFLQPLPPQLEHLDIDRWYSSGAHPDTYELLLVTDGHGYCLTGTATTPYRAGSVFLYDGHQTYTISMAGRTRMYRLTFGGPYVAELTSGGFYLPMPGPLSPSVEEQDNLQTLLTMLLAERQGGQGLETTPLVDSLVRTIVSLLDRWLARQAQLPATPAYPAVLIRRIISYISRHITEPDRLRLDALGQAFNYSPAHLSALFRQQVGDSIQQFIIQHKLRLVAVRLRQTPMTISEIADEFGFSDVCHLNKLFKRYYHHTPTTYRQQVLTPQ